jgi:hypothetical protein
LTGGKVGFQSLLGRHVNFGQKQIAKAKRSEQIFSKK